MNTEPTAKRPSWRRVLRWTVLIALGVFVVVVVAGAVWGYVVAGQLREEVAKIQAAGEPLTFTDLDADRPEVKEGDDAGRYYQAALALVRHEDSEEIWDAGRAYRDALSEIPTSRPADDVVQEVNRLLADNELALDMLDRGAERSGCRFDMGIEQGIAVCMERLSQARRAVRLVSLRTLVRASKGDGDGATDSAISLIRMARMFDHHPVMIVHLVKVACLALASQDTEIVLERGQPAEASLQNLQQVLLSVQLGEDLSRVALAERVYGLQLMRDQINPSLGKAALADQGSGALPERWPPAGFWNPPGRWMAVAYLRELAELVSASRQPWPQVLGAMEGVGSESSSFFPGQSPSFARAAVLTGKTMAFTRSALVSVMIERYRRANGKLPDALGALVPTYTKSLPLDPFTGTDLLYRHEEQSYVVYSVGENRTDDQGDVDSKEKSRRLIDVGIRIHLPRSR